MTPKLDGRSEKDLARRMLRDAGALLGPDGQPVAPGSIGTAIITTAARLFEEVTRRLDRAPEKQADNFYTAMGLGRDPAQPASVPVAITLSDTAPQDLVAAAGTKLTADTGTEPTIFETQAGIALTRGKVSALCAEDLVADSIFLAPGAVISPVLPRPAAVARFVRSAAGTGATMLQIDPVQGLAPRATLRFGTADGAAEYDVVKVTNDVVTIAPALGEQVADLAPVTEVATFAPFAPGARDRQSHALYLSHSTLLDVPAALTVSVGGVESQQVVEWQWFGRKATDPESSAPDWQSFETGTFTNGSWRLTKARGKPEKTDVAGRNGLWIRGRLAGGSALTEKAGPITLAVAGGVCSVDHHERCTSPEMGVAPAIDYEAVAVTTPIVPNKPYYPFGREPRLFDAFYVGCAEAFGKAGAEASLCFTIGGASLGALAAVNSGRTTLVFGVGTDRQLYAATFTENRPVFAPVPGPRLAGQAVSFAQQAPISARIDNGVVRLAVAGEGAIHVTEFVIGTPMTEGRMQWQTLGMEEADAANPVHALFASADGVGSIHAMAGDRILSWARGQNGEMAARPPMTDAVDLIPVQGSGVDAALIVTATETGDWKVQAKGGSNPDLLDLARIDANSLPAIRRAAWASEPDLGRAAIVVAGYDEHSDKTTHLGIRRIDDQATGSPPDIDDDEAPALPIIFEAGIGALPTVIIADAEPIRFVAQASAYARAGGITGIGASANGERSFLDFAGRTFVQDGDQGLLYRVSPGSGLVPYERFRGVKRYGATASEVPAEAGYFIATGADNGKGFLLAADDPGNRLFLPLVGQISPVNTQGRLKGRFLKAESVTGRIAMSGTAIALNVSSGPATSIEQDVVLLVTDMDRQPLGIWSLAYLGTSGWEVPQGSPPLPADASRFTLLSFAPNDAAVTISPVDYFALDPAEAARLEDLLAAGPLTSWYGGASIDAIALFDGVSAIPIDHDEITGSFLTLALPQAAWSMLGPDQPANPALSWEYWNGSSWWALDSQTSDFLDRTGNLLVDGGVYFRVPGDLQETEVGGRRNRWIRARLVGGDYGEARVTVHTEGAPPDQTQTIDRDLSAIRAPYVVALKIGYCASTPTPPEIVLTADNLGTLDQTEANKAGLPVTLFQTVADALSPAPVSDMPASDVTECCGPAAPSEEPEPDCCCQTKAAASTPLPSRTLLIGFDQPVRGSPLSFYVDALPISGDWTVEAQVFRKGRFEAARILSDSSSGLGESGVVAIEMLSPPDRAQLLGTSACWLRLSPTPDIAERWSPRLRGIYLNGVMARSVETRALETIGTSSGAPDQSFRLFANPVDRDSIDLWVSEPLGSEEFAALGALPDIAGMPGPWVRWKLAPEFPSGNQESPARLFTVDEQSGTVSFGDGRNALVPPMGSAVLARGYRHVTGAAANAVAPGDMLQPISPLAGVDKVMALDGAQGGADIEPLAQARARAPMKLLNGGRIITLTDVENYVRARIPTLSQASAAAWRGGVRLVVVGRGAALVPPPAALKAVAERLHAVAGFGLTARGRLSIVSPRLLDLRIDVTIDVDPDTDYSGVEEAAKDAIAAFFHPETGGHDGQGWPVGATPSATDVAAALADLAAHAVVSGIAMARAGNDKPVPDPLPADVLILVARSAVTVHAFAGAAA